MGVGGVKKSATFWAPHPSGPTLWDPVRGPDFPGPIFSGFGPTLWPHHDTLTHTPDPHGLAKIGLAQLGLAQIGQNGIGQKSVSSVAIGVSPLACFGCEGDFIHKGESPGRCGASLPSRVVSNRRTYRKGSSQLNLMKRKGGVDASCDTEVRRVPSASSPSGVGTGDQQIVCRVLLWGHDHGGPVEGDSVQGHTRVESRVRHRSRLSRAPKVSRLVPLGGSQTVRRDTPLPSNGERSLSGTVVLAATSCSRCHGLVWIRTVVPQVVASRHAAPSK